MAERGIPEDAQPARGIREGEREIMPPVENAKWEKKENSGGRKLSESVNALRQLQVGEVKRIIHDDIKCDRTCSLGAAICRLNNSRGGWELEYYHEAKHVLVVRRLK